MTELKLSQNKKGQKNFQVHSFQCLFLQLAAEKKTPKTVHLENFFGPSYFEAALVCTRYFHMRRFVLSEDRIKNMRYISIFLTRTILMINADKPASICEPALRKIGFKLK